MANEYEQRRVRDRLNADKIKLWLEPYTTSEGTRGLVPLELADSYSRDLSISQDTILTILETLRLHALQKLAAKQTYQTTGLASLRLKLAGQASTNSSVQIQLSSLGSELRTHIARVTGISADCLKMIHGGTIIDDDLSLLEQNVKNEAQIMVLHLDQSEMASQNELKQQQDLAKTRQAAEILSKKVEHEDDPGRNYYLQITDQSGKPLNLPPEEHTALTLAMTLHEKGRASLKRKNYTEGLLLLLEADKEFSKCSADILTAVDNYAIVCLDIVWCYFCLKNVDGLPNANEQLRSCEECFARSYGHDLQRLAAVKGSTSTEMVLFLKLHLLQAVVVYHIILRSCEECFARSYGNDLQRLAAVKGSTSTEMVLFLKLHLLQAVVAERELQQTQINDDALSRVVALGYSEREARLGLRACNSDVNRAVTYVIDKREERKNRRKKEHDEKRRRKLSRKLGKTNNGEWADTVLYENLVSMGVGQGAACEAVRRSNNNLNAALEILQTQPDIQSAPDPHFTEDDITQDMVNQLTAMGFDQELVRSILKNTSGVVETALNQLLDGTFIPPSAASSIADAATSSQEEADNKAIATIIDDIPSDDDAHLDDDLGEIKEILNEYTALLNSLPRH